MSIEHLDEEIRTIAQSVRELRSKTKLKDSTLYMLIREACPQRERPTLRQIKLVLDAAENLERTYLK
jgi:hypothetical protein